MPFQADTRCPFVSIKLNVSTVCEEIENLLDKDYDEDISEPSVFWIYVDFLEDQFSVEYSRDPNLNFWEWLPDNYNEVRYWDGMEEYFKDRYEDTSDEDEDTPEPMPEWMRQWILEQFKAIEEGELDEEKTKEFLEFVDERKDSHYIQELFKEHMKNKN